MHSLIGIQFVLTVHYQPGSKLYGQKVYQLPICVDFVVVRVPRVPLVEDVSKVDVDDRHRRFKVYCVKPEALNAVAVSLIFVCTIQTSKETSTATHVIISKQSFRQSDSDVYG